MLTSLSTPRSEKGQGLLILILFLLFIAMIVIVISRVVHSDRVQSQLQEGVQHVELHHTLLPTELDMWQK